MLSDNDAMCARAYVFKLAVHWEEIIYEYLGLRQAECCDMTIFSRDRGVSAGRSLFEGTVEL